jgi:hypothetical protein
MDGMDEAEARQVLTRELDGMRKLSYEELRARMDEDETDEVIADSGVRYQVETQIFWDGMPDRDIRVLLAIDDGGRRAYFPMTDSFILAPDGSFLGE